MTRTKDPFDELAAMFLTEPDDANQTGTTQPVKVRVELLVVAHLPVRGGLWLTPYADAVAREAGPTALLRLDGEHPTLQQLRGLKRDDDPAPEFTLREAVEDLLPATPNWIIRSSARVPTAKLLDAGADRLTVLTSADEAAVVAAYQVVKNFVDGCDGDLGCLPPIGIAVVGSDEEVARDMFERLSATARDHLGLELKLSLILPRMDAGILSTRYLSFSEEGCPPLHTVIRTINEAKRSGTEQSQSEWPSAAEAVASEPGATEETVQEPPATRRREADDAMWSIDSPDEIATVGGDVDAEMPELVDEVRHGAPDLDPALIETTRARPRAVASGPSVKLKPKPVMEVEPKELLRPREPAGKQGQPLTLADHVDGLTPILARCPNHERVELAVDAAGRMHLLTREENMRELFVVAPWAKMHRELIGMASPDVKIDPRGLIIRHLFTSEPLTVSDLHQSDLRLHVLAPVVVDGKTGWFAAPLSTGVL